jgi:hypothetical protein
VKRCRNFRVRPFYRSILRSTGTRGFRFFKFPVVIGFAIGLLLMTPIVSYAQFPFSIPNIPKIPGVNVSIPIPGLDALLKKPPAITTSFKDVRNQIVLPDDFTSEAVTPLTSLPRSDKGGFLLRPGFYESTLWSYCLHAGTHGPSQGEGYLYAPLKGAKQSIIRHILQNSVQHPELEQHDIQALIWAILAQTKVNDLQPRLKEVANQLLAREEISDLNGGALGLVPPEALRLAASKLPAPVQRVLDAENQLRQALTQSSTSFAELERIAVLAGVAPAESGPTIPSGRWSEHPGGYYVRYFPSGYSRTRVQVYVPKTKQNNKQGVEYDPSGDVAVPANTGSQRLGQSAHPADGGASDGGNNTGNTSGNSGNGGSSNSNGTQAVSPKSPAKGKTKYEERKFQTCKEAQNYIDSHSEENGFYVGKATWELNFADAPITATKQPNGSYKAQVTVNYKIDAQDIEYTLPKWSWSNMTPAEKAALQEYMDALLAHEQGHIEVAERFAKDFSQSSKVSATGATPAQAKANLEAKLMQDLTKRRQELEKDEKTYDDKTEHGGKQSKGPEWGYPGGKDVGLDCP